MKIKSVSGATCDVQSLSKTIPFYETLGFESRRKEADRATACVNWFWVDSLPAAKEDRLYFGKEAKLTGKGAGTFLYLSVEDLDPFHAGLVKKGLKPATRPVDSTLGNREFALRDPDRYRLVVFKKK